MWSLAHLLLLHSTIAAALSSKNESTQCIDPNDFVRVEGLRLYDSMGLHYITGMNYWACMNLAASDEAGGNYSRLVIELDQMAAKGINHLRIMASSEGAPTPQPFRMTPALMDAPSKYNEHIFKGLDICLDEMSKRGMRATMTLNDQWQWSGGFAQYISWATNNSQIPYPPSWNLTAPPQRTIPGTGWGNYTTVGIDAAPYDNFTDYGNLIYTNSQAEQWYHDHIKTVMNRRNTVSGRWYNKDATIMTWQLANEPQAAYDISLNRTDDPLFDWVNRTSNYIRSMAPKQLINAGLEGKQLEFYFKEVNKFKNIDYATTHLWVQNWGVYDMYNSSIANLRVAQAYGTEFMRMSSKWAADLGKPVLLEEFGMARDNWLNKDKEYPYLSNTSTSNKDAYFQTVISTVMSEFFNSSGAYVGTAPWAYGGVYRPETQHANKFGMVWAGDPPHESPGWYDLYDTDTAMDIVHAQQKNVSAWIQQHGANCSQLDR